MSGVENLCANQLKDDAWQKLCDIKDQPDMPFEILIQLRLRSNYFGKAALAEQLLTIQNKKMPGYLKESGCL